MRASCAYGLLVKQLKYIDGVVYQKICVASCSTDAINASSFERKKSDIASANDNQSVRRKFHERDVDLFDKQREFDRFSSERGGSRSSGGQYRSRNARYDRYFDQQKQRMWNDGDSNSRYASRGRNSRSSGSGLRTTNDFWSDKLVLPSMNFRNLELPAIEKNFYKEHPVVTARSEDDISRWYSENAVTVQGQNVKRPVFSFEEASFPDDISSKLLASGFTKPTEIQSVSWPIALSGSDMISIARTGSGKTLAYMLPGIVHLQNQTVLQKYKGPSVLVLAPTRELVQQIHNMTTEFWRSSGCAYGGGGREHQAKTLQRGVDILTAAPGRLLDFLMSGVVSLQRCSYLVLDEADRMLDMGFEPQIRKIISMIRPDRQTLMFSATWPDEVRSLARDFSTNPSFVNVGSLKLAANHNIKQIVEVVSEEQKEEKLLSMLDKAFDENDSKCLVFVAMKRTADRIMRMLRKERFPALSLHGDKSQSERNHVLNEFRSGRCSVLIATDVAARGLDVNDIKFVINFDCPKNGEDYIHRIGRTARHDKVGTSYTLCTTNDSAVARELIDVMLEAKQTPPKELYYLAGGKNGARVSRGRF